MSANPPEPGWFLLDGARRYWNGHGWHLPGPHAIDPGGVLPEWSAYKPADQVGDNMVTTLQALPGYRITQVHGVVTGIDTTSGRTAQGKGSLSLDGAMRKIRAAARIELGANAIVGLTTSTFGASAGGMWGDAVGVLLAGTAVTVEVDETA